MVRWESELIPTISNSKALLGDLDSVAYEITSGYGIADVVFYSLNNEALAKRFTKDSQPIAELRLLRTLIDLKSQGSHQPVSITTLRKWAPTLRPDVLAYLLESGYLLEEKLDGVELYRLGDIYENGIKESVAIEAKIKDWKRGLYQAYRYKRYADKSYLAVYSKYISSPLKNIDVFKKYNVGLIEVTDVTIKIHFKPRRKNKPDELMKAIAYENLLSYRLNVRPVVEEVTHAISV